jgi:hypothetical protein
MSINIFAVPLKMNGMSVYDSQEFLADYYQGIVTFIDENWRMIHRAAGWAALRTLLLVCVISGRKGSDTDAFLTRCLL